MNMSGVSMVVVGGSPGMAPRPKEEPSPPPCHSPFACRFTTWMRCLNPDFSRFLARVGGESRQVLARVFCKLVFQSAFSAVISPLSHRYIVIRAFSQSNCFQPSTLHPPED